MGYMPIYLKMDGVKTLVVGGGEIAARKAESLLETGAEVIVVAKEIVSYKLVELREKKKISVIERAFEKQDLEDVRVAVAATNDREVNKKIKELCKEKKILLNSVDDAENSEFIFPAVLNNGSLSIAVSTGGKAPFFSGLIRDKIAGTLPGSYGAAIETAEKLRKEAYSNSNVEERRLILDSLKKACKIWLDGEWDKLETIVFEEMGRR